MSSSFTPSRNLIVTGMRPAFVTAARTIPASKRRFSGNAARYTSDRRDNFDIWLPEWLARYNKQLFGTLYVVGIVMTLVRWMDRQG